MGTAIAFAARRNSTPDGIGITQAHMATVIRAPTRFVPTRTTVSSVWTSQRSRAVIGPGAWTPSMGAWGRSASAASSRAGADGDGSSSGEDGAGTAVLVGDRSACGVLVAPLLT